MKASKTLLYWIINSFLKSKSNQDKNYNVSLEDANQRIRLSVWFLLLLHMFTMTFVSETRLPIFFYFLCFVVWFIYLYLLLKTKNEYIKGIPFIIVNWGVAIALILKGELYYLRLTTFSLPSVLIYSVQGFPPALILVLGTGFFGLHRYYNYYIDSFYEPITASYRIPEISLENTLKGYRVGLFIEIFCLLVYQIVVQKIWKNYQIARKNLEETNQKLQSVNLQLATNVEELAKLNKQLENALQSQDLFVACVSHELRNPLNVMLGSLDLLEAQAKDSNQFKLLKTCRVCGDALLSQINNLLDVAKINADKLEISEFATNMSLFLEKFWVFTKIGLDKKKLFGSLSIDKNMPLWLNIDAQRLHQILNNLVGNAIKFTGDGSIRIIFRWLKDNDLFSNTSFSKIRKTGSAPSIIPQIPQQQPLNEEHFLLSEGERQETYYSKVLQKKNDSNRFVTFKSHQSVKEKLEECLSPLAATGQDYLKIDIIDTGCGISEEGKNNIFEPFVQGDRSVTRKYGGTGLGLYIVKSLIAKIGGELKMESQKDLGTHFQIILPIKSISNNLTSNEKKLSNNYVQFTQSTIPSETFIHLENQQVENKVEAAFKVPKRVLVVDDNIFNQNLLKEYFKKFNIECDTANDGFEGVQTYQENVNKYAFITMDIQMPGMDGISACKSIRAFEKENSCRRIPIVIVTGNCSEDERKICLENDNIQASYFFRKPFRLSDCKLCVEKIINEIQQQT